MDTRRILLSVFPLAFCAAVQAADKPCSPADSANAEKSIDRVVNWGQLHKAYQDYRHCDKDNVADVYTEAVLRLTVEWKNVNAMADAMGRDAGFKEFVRVHLQSPAAKDDQEAVYSRTKNQCPKGLDTFCTDLGALVKSSAPPSQPLMQPMEMMKPIGPAEPAKPAAK